MLGVRKKVDEFMSTFRDIAQENKRLKDENAKLRELVGEMWTYITEPVSERNSLKERLARLDDIGDRMDELGVEQ